MKGDLSVPARSATIAVRAGNLVVPVALRRGGGHWDEAVNCQVAVPV
jgi:hypothetical protein